MNENDHSFQSILNMLLIVAVIISAFAFIHTFKDTRRYGGIDLRGRVTGARLLIEGLDPYYFRWHPAYSDRLLDPLDAPNRKVSRVSVPPTVLLFHATFSWLHYSVQRIIWFFVQWVLLGLCLLILSKSTESHVRGKTIWLLGLFFFACSFFWRLHVERGQIYILYTFLMLLAYWISHRFIKNSSIYSGIILGLATTLRPTIIFMVIPMVIYRRWHMVIGTLIGILSGIISSIALSGVSVWKSYFSAMPMLGKTNLNLLHFVQSRYANRYKIIEGMDNLHKHLKFPADSSSLQTLFAKYFGLNLSSGIFLFSLIILLFIISSFLFRYRLKHISSRLLFLIGAQLVVISEYFMPPNRWPYTNVIWIIPLSLILAECDSLVLLLKNRFVILLWIGLFFDISFRWTNSTNLISDFSIPAYTMITLFGIIMQKYRKENERIF